jgi:hypothetical protein
MHSIDRDAKGRFVPVIRPKSWNSSSVKRSRERSDRIASARMERGKRLATAQWLHDLDRPGIAELEATGIPWAAVQRWIEELEPRDASTARMVATQVLHVLADETTSWREKNEARNELYRRLIAAGIME